MSITELKRLKKGRIKADGVIEFDPQLTVLAGINGSGKSSIINRIFIESHTKGAWAHEGLKEELEIVADGDYKVYHYSNSKDNFNNRDFQNESRGGDSSGSIIGFVEGLANRFDTSAQSEGQASRRSLLAFFDALEHEVLPENKMKGIKSVVLLDEIDSGLSIPTMNAYMHCIMSLVSRFDVQIILSTNSFEFTKLGPVLYVDTLEYETHSTYEEFAERMMVQQSLFLENEWDVF